MVTRLRRHAAFFVLACGCCRAGPQAADSGHALIDARARVATVDAQDSLARNDDDAGDEADPPAPAAPYGQPVPISKFACPAVLRRGTRSFLDPADTRESFVDGDDLLAVVNRSPTGALSPDYAPRDLVDLSDGSPRRASECDGNGRACLRLAAAEAFGRMAADMRAANIAPHVQSAFRGFTTQCWVFDGWAHQAQGGFCAATEQSALPGHSQHQLGTTLDLFTKQWLAESQRIGATVFRDGFGCSEGGLWLEANAWRYGFVAPYPIHPDDRRDGSPCTTRSDRAVTDNPMTGYRDEPWHLRFIGEDMAARYREAWKASDPGTASEITLEQWLRVRRGLSGDTDVPVCDGCHCGACASFASDTSQTPCGDGSLSLDAFGRVETPSRAPRILEANVEEVSGGSLLVQVVIDSPPHSPTQPPVAGSEGLPYHRGETYLSLGVSPGASPHRYPDLNGTWRVGLEPLAAGSTHWPWRASLAAPELAPDWNRANAVLPAKAGTIRVVVRVPASGALRVALLRDGVARDVRVLKGGGPP